MDPRLILKKFIKREAGREEVNQLLDHLKQNPKADFSDDTKGEWEDTGREYLKPDKDYQDIYERVEASISGGQARWGSRRNMWFKIAASVALIASVSYVMFNVTRFRKEFPEVKIVERFTLPGQKTRVDLPDGSTVLLNADSRLAFPERFESVRNIELTGEAYFEVAADADKPFFVTTENIKTIALGTAFNVRAYRDENKIQVALTKGKIKVEIRNPDKVEDYMVTPGQGVSYRKKEQAAYRSSFNVSAVTGWKDGLLYFDDASRTEVFDRLERWYGVQFEFINVPSDDSWEYTGQFENEKLENTLKSIGAVKKFDFEIDNRQVRITFNPN